MQTSNKPENITLAERNIQDRNINKATAFLVCLQEPNTHGTRVTGLDRGNHLLYDTTAKERPRTAIYASRNLNIWPATQFTTRDLTTCVWRWPNGKEIMVSSVYMDILNNRVADNKLLELLAFCQRNDKHLLLCADTNAHSSLWGSSDTNSRGRILEDIIIQYNLQVQNEGSHFTFFRGGARTNIDVTMTMGTILPNVISNWEVTTDVQGSDHLLLQWRLTISSPKHKFIRNMKLGDWSLFQDVLETLVSNSAPEGMWSPRLLTDRTSKFKNDIIRALDESHPGHYVKPKVKVLPTFTPELDRWRRKVHACFSNYRKRGTPFAFNQLKEARRRYNNFLKWARKRSWQDFTEEATDPKKAAKLQKIVQGKCNQTLGLLKNGEGTLCPTPTESMECILDTHFPRSKNYEETNSYPSKNIRDIDIVETAFLSSDRVKEAANTFGDYKAAGPDDLQPCVFKHLGPLALKRLSELYQASYLLGYIPKTWQKSRVIFLPKPGKDDYSQPRAFRPITLTSFMMKIMERLVLWHINETHLRITPLHDNQHAFRTGRSTETALTKLVGSIESGFQRGEETLAVFLDIQGAFDNVKTDSIVTAMEDKGFDEVTINWYKYYLKNRHIVVHHNGVYLERSLELGTPQGGVLSPTMWNLVFDSFLNLYENGFVKANGFADDGALYTQGKNPNLMLHRMQMAVDRAIEWGKEKGLTFAPQKTVVVLFSRKTTLRMTRQLKMSGVNIPYHNEAKYLGITLDRKLTWKVHLQNKIKKAKRQILNARNACGKLWGTNPKITRWIYTGMIQPSLTYGSLVWVQITENTLAKQDLTKVNRLALLYMGSFRRSTPTAGMEVMFYVAPLHIHIQKEACLALNRTAVKGTDLEIHKRRDFVIQGHRHFCWRIMDSLQLEVSQTDRIPVQYQWGQKYQVLTNSFSDGKPPTEAKDKTNYDYEIYTDGSGIDGSFGGGLVVYKKKALPSSKVLQEAYYLGRETSVFQGEVYSIMKAAEWAMRHCVFKKITICSDSLAALMALNRPREISGLVSNTKSALNAASGTNTITLRWIKSHKGYLGNETADEAAKEGALNANLAVTDPPLIPEAVIKRKFKEAFHTKWLTYWNNRTDCRQTKIWFPTPSARKSCEMLSFGRRKLSALVQIITGHNFLKRHESLVNDDDYNECRLCLEDEETSFHIIAECPALAGPRLRTFGVVFLKQNALQWSSREIASFIHEASIGPLLDPTEILGSGL